MSNDGGKNLAERLATPAAGWTVALAGATGLLYAAGYLSLRFQLTALGVAAELQVVDERYLFAGAHCLLYLLTILPSLLLLVLVAGGAGWLVSRLLPARVRTAVIGWCRRWSEPGRLTAIGMVWAVVAIQLVMRHAFVLGDLLLSPRPCQPRWLMAVLLDDSGWLSPLYFAGLLALVVPPILCLRAAWPHRTAPRRRLAVPVLALLVAGQPRGADRRPGGCRG
jgi:hypothetical protein